MQLCVGGMEIDENYFAPPIKINSSSAPPAINNTLYETSSSDTFFSDSEDSIGTIEKTYEMIGHNIEKSYFGIQLDQPINDLGDIRINIFFESVFITVILLISLYITHITSLILLMVTIDSVFSSVKHIILYHNFQIGIGIISDKTVNRYLYYSVLYYIIQSIFVISWGWIRLKYILIYLLAPHILSFAIGYFPFKNFIDFVHREWNKLVCNFLSKQTANAINTISDMSLDYNPKIHYFELENHISELLKNDDKYNILWGFLKSFLFASLLHYAEASGYSFYINLYRLYYFPKSRNVSSKKDRKYIQQILRKRKLGKLMKSETISVLLRVYLDDSKPKQYSIKHIINMFTLKLMKIYTQIITCWSLGSLISLPLLSSTISLVFINKNSLIKEKWKYGSIFVVSVILGYLTKSPFLASLISEMIDPVFCNKTIKKIIFEVGRKILQSPFVKSFIDIIKISILLSFMMLMTHKYFIYPLSFLLYPLISVLDIEIKSLRIVCVTFMTLACSFFSGFHPLHSLITPYFLNVYFWFILAHRRNKKIDYDDFKVITNLDNTLIIYSKYFANSIYKR